MMERPASVGNRLLAALPSKDLALLAPHLQKVSLEQDAVLAQSGVRRDHEFQHIAACNGLHAVEARMARWLLHLHDRTEGNTLSLTQETLSQLLGVRRTTVTLEIAKLRASGAIRSDRRGLIEIDRGRLEQASCECYDVMRRQTDQIVPDDAARTRLHVASGD